MTCNKHIFMSFALTSSLPNSIYLPVNIFSNFNIIYIISNAVVTGATDGIGKEYARSVSINLFELIDSAP